jgi:hypothetical protein
VEQDIPLAYKLSEGVECKNGALEKGRSFSLGPSMYPDEYYSRQRWPHHREAYPNKWREEDEVRSLNSIALFAGVVIII